MLLYSLDNERIIDIIHYKEAIKINNFLLNRDHPNIILYGPEGCGKTKLIYTIFKELYGDFKNINEDRVSFKMNSNTYIFDYNNYINKNEYIEYLKRLTHNNNHYSNDSKKYIIIDNFNRIPYNFQNNIRSIIEKSYKTSSYIIITSNISNIHRSINSLCTLIRIPLPSHYDKYIYFKGLFKKYKINYDPFFLLKDCKKYTINVILNKYFIHYEYNDIIDTLLDDIIILFNRDFDIKRFKELSVKIKELNINLSTFFYHLINCVIKNNKYIDVSVLIKEIADINYNIANSYRDIIHLESIFIRIYRLINYA